MKTTDYAVCVALDWSDQQHAFALQFAAANSKETGTMTGSPEGFHRWLEKLHARCPNQRGAVILEAGRNAVVHALVEHAGLDMRLNKYRWSIMAVVQPAVVPFHQAMTETSPTPN